MSYSIFLTDQSISRQDLKKFDEQLAVPEVCVEIIDTAVDAHQV